MRFRKLDALTVYLIMAGASSLFFALVFTVNLIYQASTLKLSPLQLVLVGTLLEITCFACEIPTGIVADVYSRRLSLIIGTFLIGVGFIVEGGLRSFEGVLLCQVIWGLGITFRSGAEQAWITDEIGEERAGRAFIRGSQVGSICGLAGIGLSVLLGSLSITLPIILGGVLFIALGMFMMAVMPETGFHPTPAEDRNSWQQMGDTLRKGLRLMRLNPVLITIVAIGLFHGLYSEGYDRLWTDHVLTNFTFPLIGNLQPVIWFGLMQAGAMLLSIFATEAIQRHVNTANHRTITRALFAINLPMVLSLMAFGLAGNFGMALLAFWLFNVLRSVAGPFYYAWINQHFESSVRATMYSMSGQVDAVGQIVGGPIIGGVATGLTGLVGLGAALRITMIVVGMLLSPVLLLYARTSRREIPVAEPIGV